MTVARIDGETIFGPFSFSLTSGTEASKAVALVTHESAAKLLNGPPRPCTLEISSGGENGLFKNLYVIAKVPSGNPEYSAVLIVDQRYWWSYYFYKKSFNISRNAGVKLATDPQGPTQPFVVVPDIKWAKWSLYNQETPWKISQVIEELKLAIIDAAQTQELAVPDVKIEPIRSNDVGADTEVFINWTCDGNLDSEIERTLGYINTVDVTVDPDGSVIFYNIYGFRGSQKGQETVEAVGGGHLEKITNERARPRAVRVFFTVRSDLRFDFEELDEGATSDRAESTMDMANVVKVDDWLLLNSYIYPGTWAPIPSVLTAWNSSSYPGTQLSSPLTLKFLRRAMAPFNDLWNYLEGAGLYAPNADWVGRGQALQSSYRTIFRLNPYWMQRIDQLYAARVGTTDIETGTKRAASVFSDYSMMRTQRSTNAERILLPNSETVIVNIPNYPSDGHITETSRSSNAIIQLISKDQGILKIDYQTDTLRLYGDIFPSQIEVDGTGTLPGNKPAGGQEGPKVSWLPGDGGVTGLGYGMIPEDGRYIQLTDKFKLAVIVSATPSSPNNKTSCLYVEIPAPADVPSTGPIMEIHIGPELAQALLRWDDSRALDIRNFFSGDIKRTIEQCNIDNYTDLVVNYSAVQLNKGPGFDVSIPPQDGGLNEVAQAVAQRVYDGLRDRFAGSITTKFKPETPIRGSTQEVSHVLNEADGSVLTKYTLPPKRTMLDLVRYFPSSLRRILFKIPDERG